MKLDFFSSGGGSKVIPRRLIERYMAERLDIVPLDDARRTVRIGMIGAGLFFGVFLLFAMFAPISGAAVATGEVSISGNRLVIQPVSTGVVTEFLVREGQAVRPGQPLVRFNGVRSGANLKQAQARRDVLRAAEARLIAERDNHERLLFPPDIASRSADPTAAAAMQAQMSIFERHRAILEAERAISDAQLRAAQAERRGSERQLALVEDELAGIRELYAKGFARKSTLRALERSAVQLETQGYTGEASVAQAELNRQKTRDAQVMQIVNELAQVQEQLAQTDPQLDVSRYNAERDILRAPTSGRVANVAEVGPGTVVSGGRTLMELVPDGRSLIVEARIKPQDVDDVRVGSEATVRFTSVNPRGKSAFKGKVVTLSPARIDDPQGGTGYYRAQIVLDNPAEAAEAGVSLQPGIPATVNIKTHDRTLLNYLLAPLSDAVSGGFREE